MVHLDRILVYPIKSLDSATVESAAIVENGALEWDRRYALVDEAGRFVNGKRERKIHRIGAHYDLDRETVTLWTNEGPEDVDGVTRATNDRTGVDAGAGTTADATDRRPFHLEDERDALASWVSSVLGYSVDVVRNDEGGFPDDTDASGPTVITTGTLAAVASWFEAVDVEDVRRRFRANLELDGVEAFWEDRLYDEPGRVVPVAVGEAGVEIYGVNPCQRCVVPTRDPDTGAPTEGFRARFVTRRRETLPDWACGVWYGNSDGNGAGNSDGNENNRVDGHYFRLMVNTRVPKSSWGETLSVGDPVVVGESIPVP